MSGAVPSLNPTGYLGIPERNPPDIIAANRDPLTTDYRNVKIGDFWYNKVSKRFWILVSLASNTAIWDPFAGSSAGDISFLTGNSGGAVTGNASGNVNLLGSGLSSVVGNPSTNTLTITASSGAYPITPYVVGPSGKAGYQTIQSAINAANAAGGGTVYIQPGTYTENLSLFKSVNLTGYAGEGGAVGIYTNAGMVPSVVIIGNLVIDTSADQENTYNTFTNIMVSPATGNCVKFYSNQNYESAINFIGCSLFVTEAGKFAFSCDGFPVVNMFDSTVTETNAGTCDLLELPGSFNFFILKANNCYFAINHASACALPTNCDVHFYLKDCYYTCIIDTSSAATSFFSLDCENCTFFWAGSTNEPLVNFGAEDGYVNINGSVYLSGSGGFSSSTSVSSNSFFRIKNSYISSNINLNHDCKENYYNCTFLETIASCITMSSAQSVSLNSCSIDCSFSPAIGGAGAGTITLNAVSFQNNSTIAGTVIVGYRNSFSTRAATFTTSTTGTTESLTVSHSSNTASSSAQINTVIAGTSAGDAWNQWTIGSSRSYALGPDTDSSATLKLTTNASASITPSTGTTLLESTTSGVFSMPQSTSALYIGTNAPPSPVDLNVQKNLSGGSAQIRLDNTSNTASSDASLGVIVGGTSAGDPTVGWNIASSTNWTCGIRNSVSDVWRLCSANTLSDVATVIQGTVQGEITMPLQPAFSAYNSTARSNETGDGTVYTLIFNTEQYDQNSDFDGVSTFTAPVTGKYHFDVGCLLTNLGAGHTTGTITITKTGLQTYYGDSCNVGAIRTAANNARLGFSVDIPMNAADTVTAEVMVSGSTKTVGIDNTAIVTFFNGRLVV